MSEQRTTKQAFQGSLHNDPVIQRLFERVPQKVQDSFTEEQLIHLKVAVGSRGWGEHTVDIRGSFRGWKHRYYYVMLFGRNRRQLSPGQQHIHNLLSAGLLSVLLMGGLLLGFMVLYLLKSALGIDLLPNHSLGLWDWFKS
ncbi:MULTISPECIES: 3-phosphoshikimate 1-carboxyvinyltransferase [Corallincola]|uniref:3-phosphoshikimate 1-carboxyvinyltransferase n=2 Tax=Corallincola TaxID=1775176 RepID=A0A368NKU7_9GAMM|nr:MULTISPECIES: 3-phosphoshikimate 1-carboxyvinyltransferase [Corallincola]RCU50395.1 3-phosphoshikimate 1-carboxyvinyltransferase [Corallincola holothuriorum]TAA48594.1 3-phosphoshikimate 1-carboxyvinyltransferase [Corallincola spongiicola]